jgi:formate-dependent nitrite reductase membrane component NrfD
MLIYPAVLLLGIAYLDRDEVDAITSRLSWLKKPIEGLRVYATRNLRKLEWANVVLGIALGTYTGILLGTLGARALWSSGLLGPLFLISGLSTGAALLMLFPIYRDERKLVRNLDIAAIGVEIFLIAMLFVDLLNGSGELGRRAASLFFGGPYTATFWALVVFAGLLVPLFMEVYESRRRVHAGFVAPFLLLVGGLALRWIFVSAGQVGL